ncbi:phage tail assembly protein [Azonexus sp.]|uniref:phage tail assembly protein n=1 Tax=Azonexus sp. TaxID=1872668 RepID=UPI0035AF3078
MEKTIEIPLAHPITYGDKTISTLILRRPKAGDFRGLKGMDMPFDMILDFAASLSDLSPAVIDRLDVEDMPKLIEVVSGFLGGFPATGKT